MPLTPKAPVVMAYVGTPADPPITLTNAPAEVNDSFVAAASDAPVLNCKLVALLLELKSPSEVAAISAATKIASVPAPSSGAWN